MAQTVLHKANTRGKVDHGWLKSFHTFSFAEYYNPERVHFGALRVLNDDSVDGGMGFGDHPHDNMEIISIPLEGELEHADSMNNVTVIKPGDIQVMSAGTGVYHQEYNKNKNKPVKFLQIWVLPNQRNVPPRYDQVTLNTEACHNRLQQILSPYREDEGVWIYQNAWFHWGNFDTGFSTEYEVKCKENGVYVFILNGHVEVNGQPLSTRDGYGIWEAESLSLKAASDSEFLLIEVPMDIS